MGLVAEQWAFLQDVARLIIYAADKGITLTGGELYRTDEQQELHYKAGRTKTMKSNHLRRLAIDFNFFIDGKLTYDIEKLRILGGYWEGLTPQNRWGGNYTNFKDTPHFERVV